ncbi:glycosyltransferase family 2 protein [Algoriphagus sp.]|uniref:glycosyltransferase family A protein n=1 Tax=Algoriphagus sp. TaxID=1872435 RepID=UPI00262F6A87|nr:glycosyltransferase family 2 protein [Algoriphagus sp.]
MNPGVSIVICTYNGLGKLYDTLQHICELKSRYSWELIVIDNNSLDDSFEFSLNFLKKTKIDYRVEKCKVPGKMNAFWMGIRLANYDYILDCDDDNHLFSDYIQTGLDFLFSHPTIGALGGLGIPKLEYTPDWFRKFSKSYAVGPQGQSGEVLELYSHLYGAGCFYKKAPLLELEKRGFTSLLTCRKGDSLSSGGDVELCYALQLMGFDLVFLDKLKFYHAIPRERLDFDYYLKLKVGISLSFPILASYRVNEFKTISQFKKHLFYALWISLKGVIKSFTFLNETYEVRVSKVVTMTKLKFFFKNYSFAIAGFNRNKKLFNP